ncbi:MAG: poly-gamma-glutamate synthase PgsB [Spirochaetes bacterium]|nr:poly-gamma-glutamate synthase PgsB [Spirochaetota bacterium]
MLVFCIVASGLLEYYLHKKNLDSIPIRIHVNGTRGKSSVTRLIAAGLREGGIKTFAKTTGTLPKMIISDGTEYPVFRRGRPNIIEQLRIVSFAASNNARALVIECMALQPFLQTLCELKIIKSTHGVITNVREDHLDVMGPAEKDVALALLGTAPVKSRLYTCETDYRDEFNKVCTERDTELITVEKKDIQDIPDSVAEEFQYFEHKENIALALKVCESIGVRRDTALSGMKKAAPDVGAMSDFKLNFFGREIFFINGFAANDPESTETIWRIAINRHKNVESRILVINSRIDRPDRSRQFGESIVKWPLADKYILIGSGSYFLIKYAIKSGMDPRHFINAEDLVTESVFEEILNYCKKATLVMGIGNIAGPGLELIKYFSNRSQIMQQR